jgi:hypothetical protein
MAILPPRAKPSPSRKSYSNSWANEEFSAFDESEARQSLRHAPHVASGLPPLKAKRLKIAIEFLRQLRTA